MRLQWWRTGAIFALLSWAPAAAQSVKRAPSLLVIIPADDSQSVALAGATTQRLHQLVDSSALTVFSAASMERARREWPYEAGPPSSAVGGPAMLPSARAQLAVMMRADLLIAFAPDSARSRSSVTVLLSPSPKFSDARAIGTWHIDDVTTTAQHITTAMLRDTMVVRVVRRRR